ncbi:probable serine/threonine-protein kinase DDB_G0282963 [Anopheles marshallii]|uniref:probable serine/threonine-protein kinase DDB_G0282963 n=1 Tax=Anopheles marshallii TaxID=1521116 RepID=UPI00237C35A8|nr:probable serine/threonine-protein kinase DDB_G0282963 [Anopheles marshallii]
MWNKLFKTKSKSSKNLSNRSCSSGLEITPPNPGPSKSTSNGLNLVAQYEQYGSSFGEIPEPVRMRLRTDAHDPNALDLASTTNHRDSIGVEMCGIPMRRSKLSSAFKSLSLKRSASKSRLKLVTNPLEAASGHGTVVTVDTDDTEKKNLTDYEILTAGKRASLRPCKSDNNLNEKQQYTETEKEEPVYIEECKSYKTFDPSFEPPPNLELQPCPICLRKFAPLSLTKHTSICERVQTKKRKPFDSSRQRREGTELASYLPKNFGLPQKTVSSSNEAIPVRKLSLSKTPTFERKEFSPTTMSTSMPSAACTPKPVLKRSMSQQNEPCPYCERCFGMKAYDRHVEWCREKALLNRNVNNNQTISAAKERLQARIQYKAPQIRSKRALNREKYSGSLSCGGSTNSLAELDLHMPRHNSMSSSVSSDNRKFHLSPHSLQQNSLGNILSLTKEPKIIKREEPKKGTKRAKTLTLSSERLPSDTNNNNNNNSNVTNKNSSHCNHSYHTNNLNNNRIDAGCRTHLKNLLNRSTIDSNTTVHKQHKQLRTTEQRVEKFEIIGHNHSERMTHRPVIAQTVRCTSNSGYSPDRYDPFLSARRQLEELFSPATSLIHASSPGSTTSTSRLNQMSTNGSTASDKSTNGGNTAKSTHHNSNFRRAYSLRMPRKVSRPMYVEKAKSNIQKGITDDGPVSPNFLKSSEYDELPIKSTFNALQMTEPKPKLRDSSTVRKNLKLDIKDPNNPAGGEIPLSKTDSLAVFLKYENELAFSEKDMKDKSNSLSKRTSSLSAEANQQKKQDLLNIVHPVAKNNETITTDEEQIKTTKRSVPTVEHESVKKQAQKLIPIKLEPITYNSDNVSESVNIKPMVISLDAIIGKTSITKQKELQVDNDNRADTSYIDPKLINKCDNLPITLVKSSTKDIDGSCSSRNSSTLGNISAEGKQFTLKTVEPKLERSVAPPPPPRVSISVAPKPPERTRKETSFDYSKTNDGHISSTESSTSNNSSPTASHSSTPVDHRVNQNSTNCDKRPQLTRQDREDSGYRTGHELGQSDAQEQSKNPSTPTSTIKRDDQPKPKSPGLPTSYNLDRLVSPRSTLSDFVNTRSPSSTTTPSSSDSRRDRSVISSALEHFDVDEFMQSLEDLHRRSPASAKDYKHSLFARTNSSVSSRRALTTHNDSANGKRSNSLDSGHSKVVVNSIHYAHNNESSGVPRVDVCVRNGSGTASNNNSSNSSSSFSSPSHYSISSNSYYNSNSINNKTPHNHSTTAGNGLEHSKGAEVVQPLGQQLNNMRNSPAIARRRMSEDSAAISLPAVPTSSSNGPAGGSTFLSTKQNLPNIHKPTAADPALNGNGKNVQQATNPYYSSPSPVNGRNTSYSNKSYHANHTTSTSSSTPTSTHPTGYMYEARYQTDSFDHLERDLLKSVQELNRMCGSSSSVCSIDSEELYSVEDFPLNKRSSERSQASADSAYRSSLSTQSPPDYAPPVPIRQVRPGSRSSTTSQNQLAQSTTDSSFNSLPLHTSLPPITSVSVKGHKQESHPYKDSPDGIPNLIMNPMSKFCHECGARFMISSAKFCMSCGVRRITLE